MSLRGRLALTVLLTAVPLAAGVLWLRAELEHRSHERALREFVLTAMQAGGREVCESYPEAFPDGPAFTGFTQDRRPPRDGPPRPLPPHRADPPPPPRGGRRGGPPPPRPGPEPHLALWAYGPDFRSANPAAPPLPGDLRHDLERGRATASVYFDYEGRRALRLVARMPWQEGPCAVVMVERTLPPKSREGDVILWGLALLLGGVLVAVLLAAGPVVARIRRLEREVRRSAAVRYESEVAVEGGDEIAELARAFNDAGCEVKQHLAEIESREATLRRFVADTTHDVMIPLTVLQGHLSAIRKRVERGEAVDEDEVRASLEEAHYLGSLLHNLDAVARLETEAEEEAVGEPVALGPIVERVISRHRPIARGRGIELEYATPDEPVVIQGDVTLLEQAVSNLVHNAVRYNQEGGHVSVVLERDEDRFALRVLDDGPGVPEEELQHLTERRFRSTRARTRRGNGRGLGLAIAADVARRHGLTLTFRRLEPQGLEARLEGPCLAVPEIA